MSTEGKQKGHFASDVHSKSEPASNFIVQSSDSDICTNDNETNTQTQIKEEPVYREIFLKSEPVDADFYSDAKNDITEGDQEFLFSESAGLDAKTPWNYGFGVVNADMQNGYLKLKFCHETGNTNVVHGFKNERPHNLIHEPKQQFTCDRCDKNLTTAASLKTHNLIHEDKRPFKCEVCFKSFTRSEHLKRHNLIHEGKRPFKCYVCDKSFTRSEHLKRHNLIHDGKKLFKCGICYKDFTRSEHLKAHYLIHKVTKPLNSDNYDEFITLENFERHLICKGKRTLKHDM